jgi:hypothetical protein
MQITIILSLLFNKLKFKLFILYLYLIIIIIDRIKRIIKYYFKISRLYFDKNIFLKINLKIFY